MEATRLSTSAYARDNFYYNNVKFITLIYNTTVIVSSKKTFLFIMYTVPSKSKAILK